MHCLVYCCLTKQCVAAAAAVDAAAAIADDVVDAELHPLDEQEVQQVRVSDTQPQERCRNAYLHARAAA
jgi:hypothetical protein